MSVPQSAQQIQIRPIINYPREAQIGQTYLMSIDVQLAAPGASWPYPDEEYPITFILNTQPYFRYEPLNGEHEPGIVLHRFGGTYGPAQYLLTASEQEVERGHISITFLNGWGLPVTYLELECVVKAELAADKGREITVLSEKKVSATSKASFIVEEEKLSGAETYSSQETVEESHSQQEVSEVGMIRLDLITEQLKQTGWTLYQFSDQELLHYFTDRDRSEGIAVTSNLESSHGYFLFVAGRPIGTIATATVLKSFPAEPITTDALISVMQSVLNISIIHTGYNIIPFIYEIRDTTIRFTNYLEPESQSRRVFTFHRPETLASWLEQVPPNVPVSQNNLFRSRLKRMPTLQRKGLRSHQFEAIGNLESSLALNHRHALIQMETGTGVTFTALNIIHRLLEYGGARRILYALDTPIAKDYVIDVLQEFVPSGETIKFIDLYDTDYLQGNRLDPSASICIATLEQFYRAFIADFLAHLSENISHTSRTFTVNEEHPEANYNSIIPIEYFDAIVLANWDSHLHQIWQPFLDYFDTFIVGFTEDADERLVSLFADNLVYEQATKLSQIYRSSTFILTTLPIEYEAVLRHLSNLRKETDGEVVYEHGEFADKQWHWDVGIMQVQVNNPEAAYEAQRVLRDFDPSIILFVGIATGVKDVVPGDIVVADTVASFELNTIREEQLPLPPKISSSSEQLLQKARIESHMHNWRRRIRYNEQAQTLENIAPRVLIGQLVAVSTVGTALRFSRRLPNDALAMEMGSRDLFYAADLSPDTETLIIRGISDRTDNIKEIDAAGSQERAAHYAAAFAFEMLAKLGVDGAAKLDAELSDTPATTMPDTTDNFEIFYAYAREDRALVRQLQRHLAVLTRQDDNITEWDESKIMPGQSWRREMEEHLNTARVILVFISLDFLASEQLSSLPWEYILKRGEMREVVIIPILLRPADWRSSPFYRFQALPHNRGSIIEQRSTDRVFAEIAQEITRIVERLRASSA